jgi:type II secretory pathway pseudopilin PulG
VGLVELFVAVLIVGISCVNAAPPLAAWSRSHDARFVLLASAQLALAALGGVWVWGQLPASPPGWTAAQLPVLGVVLVIALLFLATTLGPRRT